MKDCLPSRLQFEDCFNLDALEKLTNANDSYIKADPYPHGYFDDVFSERLLDQVLVEFPEPDSCCWHVRRKDHSIKASMNDLEQMGPYTRQLIEYLNGPKFLMALESLSGITGLIPDPYLWGGGLHRIERNGFLNVHADFNIHHTLQLERRLNLLLYLNKDWSSSYGGDLELWNSDVSACRSSIAPVFNRCAVFSTSDISFHGHPAPLTCPEGEARKSIALYYYTTPNENTGSSHPTLWQSRSKPSLLSRFAQRFRKTR